jgi:subtilisin family serine protease
MRSTSPRRSALAVLVAVLVTLSAVGASSLAGAAPAPEPTVRFLVTFDRGTPRSTQDRTAGASGRVVQSVDAIGLRTVEVPAGRAAAERDRLLRHRDVQAVELDTLLHADRIPNDPSYPSQWSAPKVKLPAAWDVTTGSDQVVVAVIDTGVTPTSPDLPSSKLVPGRNVIASSSNTTDDNGHGTAAASVATMVGDNAARAAGACWQCRVMPIKVLGSNGSGSTSNVAAGIVWALDHGADVLNLSLSGGGTTALRNAVTLAESRGVVVVASAGNGSTTAITYPAGYTTALSIAATDSSDRATSYTNRGTWVKLAAPGTSLALNRSGSVVSFSGTSAAAPLVAGTIGLLLSTAPGLTPAQIRSALMSTADPASVTLTAGSGRLDAEGALAAVGATAATTTSTSTSTSTTSTSTTSTSTSTTSTSTTSTSTTSTSTTSTTLAPTSQTTVTGEAFANRSVTRTLTVGAGPVRFTSTCKTGCAGQILEILSSTGALVTRTAGTTNVTLNASLAGGTYTFRITTWISATVSYSITHTT